MNTVLEQLRKMFAELNSRVEEINRKRREEGGLGVPKASVRLLGQMSLLSQEKVSAILSLAQTGDLDALLRMEDVVKNEFKTLLREQGLVYDEDSYLIWIPPGAVFEGLLEFDHVTVEAIDPESALVSKAVKDPRKNAVLIREAIASEKFPTLVQRIVKNGGKLGNFA